MILETSHSPLKQLHGSLEALELPVERIWRGLGRVSVFLTIASAIIVGYFSMGDMSTNVERLQEIR